MKVVRFANGAISGDTKLSKGPLCDNKICCVVHVAAGRYMGGWWRARELGEEEQHARKSRKHGEIDFLVQKSDNTRRGLEHVRLRQARGEFRGD